MTHPPYPPQPNPQQPPHNPSPPPPAPTGFITTTQPPAPDPHTPGHPTPRQRRSISPLTGAAIAFIGVAAILAAGILTYINVIREDPGITACKAMAESQKNRQNAAEGDREFTQDEYKQLRGMFADSKHSDIREHGTALVDLAWEVSKLKDGEELGILAFMGPLTDHTMGLKTACANEGVMLDMDLGK